MSVKEIITRRRLPHWYVPGAAHFITYRLHGSLPQQAIDQLKARKAELTNQVRGKTLDKERAHKQLFAMFDSLLDRCHDERLLTDPRVAAVIRSNLYHHHGSKYFLHAYCVMANHVHVLLQPTETCRIEIDDIGEHDDSVSPLSKIMHSLKSYTAHEANRRLHRTGTFWQSESYDHWVRDEDELERIVNYIMENPMKAGIVQSPQHAYFSSCHDRYLTDGEISGWLIFP